MQPVRRAIPLGVRLLLELVVVFVGVYAAAMLAQRQARLAEEEHSRALRRALAAELAFIHQQGSAIKLDEIVDFADSISAGHRPELFPFTWRVPFAPDVWEATLASGGVRLMEPSLVVAVSKFYGEMRGFMAELDDNRAYTRDILLPNLGRPPSEFYQENGRLRTKYGWYLSHMRYVARQVPMLVAQADSLRAAVDPDQAVAADP
jgi:hypothetical protein